VLVYFKLTVLLVFCFGGLAFVDAPALLRWSA